MSSHFVKYLALTTTTGWPELPAATVFAPGYDNFANICFPADNSSTIICVGSKLLYDAQSALA